MPRRTPTTRGKSLFSDAGPESKPAAAAAYRINIDGASRGNPGPASYGIVIRDARGETVAKLKKYIGRFTNNVAEYYGLIAAMDYAQSHGARAIRVESDSELLVKQMRGLYKVKSAAGQRGARRNRRQAGQSARGKGRCHREHRSATNSRAFSWRRAVPSRRRWLARRHGRRSHRFSPAKTRPVLGLRANPQKLTSGRRSDTAYRAGPG